MISSNPFKCNYIATFNFTNRTLHVERYQTSFYGSIGAALMLLSAVILIAFGGA